MPSARRRRLMAAAAGLTLLPTARRVAAAEPPRIAWPAIELIDGRRLAPSAWQDTAAVVVFWATHCPFCRRHNAHVQKLFEAVAGQPLRVLTVAVGDTADAVRRYLATHRYGFPVALDDGRLRARFTSRAVIPTTCVVDRDGRLVQTITGEMFEEDVLELPALALRPAAARGT